MEGFPACLRGHSYSSDSLHRDAHVNNSYDDTILNSISATSPCVCNVSTPNISDFSDIGENSISASPCAYNLPTPVIRDFSDNSDSDDANNESDMTALGEEGSISVTPNPDSINSFDFQKYTSNEFLSKNDVNYEEVSGLLKKIRLRNVNRVIIGHLNVNFFAPKHDVIKTIIPGNVDIMIFGETKLDGSYPTAQLKMEGFKKWQS